MASIHPPPGYVPCEDGPSTPAQRTKTLAPAVLVIEDHADVACTLCRFIEHAGMTAQWAQTGADAMAMIDMFEPDVVLLDMTLPDTNGVHLIRWLCERGGCGIIVVSGAHEEAERVICIELGADDYMVKPPALRELVARIRAVHRRTAPRRTRNPWVEADPEPAPRAEEMVRMGRAAIDLRRRQVSMDGKIAELTDAECRALTMLLNAGGHPVSREAICEAALRRKLGFEDRSVDQLILKLRRKLGADGGTARLISSVRGAGYALQP